MRRLVAAVLVVAVAVLVCPQSAGAAPAPDAGSSSSSATTPPGFPAYLRKFVAGTDEFKTAPWSTACQRGGSSAGPNTDDVFGVANPAGKAGGVDVGRYLEAAAKYLPLLAWWTQSQDARIVWWKTTSLLDGDYPGDAKARTRSPKVSDLPRSPATLTAGLSQYPHGYCSAELAQWATPADTTTGFAWEQTLDATSIAEADRLGSAPSEVKKSPCNKLVDRGQWCSIAYYVDCSRASAGAAASACTHWNLVNANHVGTASTWVQQNKGFLGSIAGFLAGIGSSALGFTADVVDFFADIADAYRTVIDFIKNAKAGWQSFVNDLKKNALSLIKAVLTSYNTGTDWNLGEGGFLRRYALVAGLGIVLMAFMFLGAIRKAADTGDRAALAKVLKRALLGVVTITWAPALFQLLATSATSASADIVDKFTGGEGGDALKKLLGVNSVTSDIPGGAFIGFILFLLMAIGALALLLGLIVQRYGMEMAATLIPLVFGVYVHPRFKRKVEKAMWVVVGLILAKPLTMIVLGATFGMVNDGLTLSGGGIKTLIGLILAAIAMVVVGFAPFAALKWAPILPTGAESMNHQRGAGGMSTIGTAGQALAGLAAGGAAGSGARGNSNSAGRGGSSPASRGKGGVLTQALDRGLGRGQAGGSSAGSRASIGAGSGAGSGAGTGKNTAASGASRPRVGSSTGRSPAATRAAAVGAVSQVGAAAATRGRALADNHTPQVDLAEDGEDR